MKLHIGTDVILRLMLMDGNTQLLPDNIKEIKAWFIPRTNSNDPVVNTATLTDQCTTVYSTSTDTNVNLSYPGDCVINVDGVYVYFRAATQECVGYYDLLISVTITNNDNTIKERVYTINACCEIELVDVSDTTAITDNTVNDVTVYIAGGRLFGQDLSLSNSLTVPTTNTNAIDEVISIMSKSYEKDSKGFKVYEDNNGKSYAELDNLLVRSNAIINDTKKKKITYLPGGILISNCGSIISSVEEIKSGDTVTGYKCYINVDNGSFAIENNWVVGMQVLCKTLNVKTGVYDNVLNKYYWRTITSVATDGSWIVLSNLTGEYDAAGVFALPNSVYDSVPATGDDITLFGVKDSSLSAYADAVLVLTKESFNGIQPPSIIQLSNIIGFNLTNKTKIIISPSGNSIIAKNISFETPTGEYIAIPKDKGEYIVTDAYDYYDRVSYNGSLWLCISNTGAAIGVKPGDNDSVWLLQVKSGESGVSITSTQDFYLASSLSSGVTTSTAGWGEDGVVPQLTQSLAYLWNYQKFNYSDSTFKNTTPKIVSGVNANIKSITKLYNITNSSTSSEGPGWTTTPYSVSSTQRYLWEKTRTIYVDNTVVYSTPAIIGVYGDQGPKGDTGNTGPKGDTGANGANGSDGANGSNGSDGANGFNVSLVPQTIILTADDNLNINGQSHTALTTVTSKVIVTKGTSAYTFTASIKSTSNCSATISNGTINVSSIDSETLTDKDENGNYITRLAEICKVIITVTPTGSIAQDMTLYVYVNQPGYIVKKTKGDWEAEYSFKDVIDGTTITNFSGAIQHAATLASSTIDTKIALLQTGVRNLAEGTSAVFPFISATDYKSYPCSITLNELAGKSITIGFNYIYSNASTGATDEEHRMGITFNGKDSNNNAVSFASWYSLPASGTALEGAGRYTSTIAIPTGTTFTTDSFLAYIQITSGYAEISKVKVEIGTVASDWSEAPEDIEADYTSKITQTANSIMTQVNSVSSNLTTTQNNLATAQTDISGIKTQLTNVTGDISTLNSNASTMQAAIAANSTAITQNANAIATKVETTAYTSNNTVINNKFTAIEQTSDEVRLYAANSAASYKNLLLQTEFENRTLSDLIKWTVPSSSYASLISSAYKGKTSIRLSQGTSTVASLAQDIYYTNGVSMKNVLTGYQHTLSFYSAINGTLEVKLTNATAAGYLYYIDNFPGTTVTPISATSGNITVTFTGTSNSSFAKHKITFISMYNATETTKLNVAFRCSAGTSADVLFTQLEVGGVDTLFCPSNQDFGDDVYSTGIDIKLHEITVDADRFYVGTKENGSVFSVLGDNVGINGILRSSVESTIYPTSATVTNRYFVNNNTNVLTRLDVASGSVDRYIYLPNDYDYIGAHIIIVASPAFADTGEFKTTVPYVQIRTGRNFMKHSYMVGTGTSGDPYYIPYDVTETNDTYDNKTLSKQDQVFSSVDWFVGKSVTGTSTTAANCIKIKNGYIELLGVPTFVKYPIFPYACTLNDINSTNAYDYRHTMSGNNFVFNSNIADTTYNLKSTDLTKYGITVNTSNNYYAINDSGTIQYLNGIREAPLCQWVILGVHADEEEYTTE